jgi:hypothetical protein
LRSSLAGTEPSRAVWLAVVLSCAWPACGTAYQPTPSARVGFVIHHGAMFYVKNGREVPIGPLGGSLEPLVASSPPAASRAHSAHTQLMFGVPMYVGGIATVAIGLALAWTPVGWIVIGAGVASGGTGLGLMGAGVTNTVDAVNIHNDSDASADASARAMNQVDIGHGR